MLSLAPDGAPEESFDDDDKPVNDFLVHLRADGMATGPPWQFTAKGLQSLACGLHLTELRKVCTRMEKGADLFEATFFELLLEMDAAGFECKDLSDKGSIADAQKNPYVHGLSPKTWFKRASNKACSHFYMIAFLKVDEHRKPVPHFAGDDNVYRALLGMEQKRVAHKKVFRGSGACPDDFDVKAPRAKLPKKLKVLERDDESGDGEPVIEDDGDEDSDAQSSVGDGGGDEVSDSSSGSSSGSSSSSSNSGSSSENDGGEAVDAVGGAARRNMGASYLFGPHLITPRIEGGFQLTCKHPSHRLGARGARCTKTQNASQSTGGADGALRRLKFWASMANDSASKEEHQATWEHVKTAVENDLLPSMEDLDKFDLACVVAAAPCPAGGREAKGGGKGGGASSSQAKPRGGGASSSHAEPPSKKRRASK